MNNEQCTEMAFDEYKLLVEKELLKYLVDGTFDRYGINTVCDVSIDTEQEGLTPAEEAIRLMNKEGMELNMELIPLIKRSGLV